MTALPTIAIFGPTGVGKTAVAVELAESLRSEGLEAEAVSADAYAVYLELAIISGAPTQDQRDRLAHAMVGVASVTDEFSAGRFAGQAHSEIDRIRSNSKVPVVVGGTGLYLRAALSDLNLNPPASIGQSEMAGQARTGGSRSVALSSDAAGCSQGGRNCPNRWPTHHQGPGTH